MMYCVLVNVRMELVFQLRLVYNNSTYLQWPSLLRFTMQNFRNPMKHFNYCNDFKWRQGRALIQKSFLSR